MENYTGRLCAYCKLEIANTDDVVVCPSCGMPHHKKCWNENKGCTTFGCNMQNSVVPMICSNCGQPIQEGQLFCMNCGVKIGSAPKAIEPQTPGLKLCRQCGTQLRENEGFCHNCGAQVNNNYQSQPQANAYQAMPNQNVGYQNQAINNFNANIANNKKKDDKKKVFIIIAVIAAIAFAIILYKVVIGSRFDKMFSDYRSESWCYISSDGRTMEIDTNPYDKDDYLNRDAYNALIVVNEKLGFSDGVIEQMKKTRFLDGRQYAYSDKYMVSWTYHPDKGLEATYTRK